MNRPAVLGAAAATCVLAGGAAIAVTWHLSLWHGVYCALGTATTVGCDASPDSTAGRIASAAVMLTAIPLLAAAFAQLHLDKVREHVDARLGEHRRDIHERLDRIEHGNDGSEAK